MARINSQDVNYSQLTKIQKLSVFLIAIGPEAASEVLSRFDEVDVEALCREIASIKIIDDEIRDKVLEEFASIIGDSITSITGGSVFAQKALELSIGDYKAASIIDKIAPGGSAVELIKEVGDMKPRQIFNLMKNEQPQTIAFLVSHLNLAKAVQVVDMLPPKVREEVVEYIGTMDSTPLEMVARVVQSIKPHLNNKEQYVVHQSGGVRMVAELMNMLDKDLSKSLLASLEERNAPLGASVRKKMFGFDDLIRLSPSDLQRAMREVEMSDLVLAMKSANIVLQEAIFGSVSKRAAETLREEMELLGAVRLKAVEEAQEKVIQVVRRLDEEGEIQMDPGGEGNVVS